MREAHCRCIHCGVVYTAYLSGGPPEGYADTKYCPDCHGTIRAALEKVPRRFERRTMHTRDIPAFENVRLEHILEWEREEDEWREKQATQVRRVAFPLFDLQNPDNRNHARYVTPVSGPHKGCEFLVSTWSQEPDRVEIRVEVEWDILQDKYVAPWKWYRRY